MDQLVIDFQSLVERHQGHLQVGLGFRNRNFETGFSGMGLQVS